MNTVISQGQKSAQPRLPKKANAEPVEITDQPRPMESPMVALVNQRQAAFLDVLSEQQEESPLYALVNQRQAQQLSQSPSIQLESPIHALINGREQRQLDELPAQQESPLYALVNHR